jgi:hypothetical protein
MEAFLGFLTRIWAAVQGLRARRAAADVKAGEEIIRQADAEAATMQPPPLPTAPQSSKPN